MPRALTTAFRNNLQASQTSDNAIFFVTGSGGGLGSTLRWNSDNCDYILGGNRFVGVSFAITILTDTDQPPTAQAGVMNVDRVLGKALQGLTMSPTLLIEIYARSDFGAIDAIQNARLPIGTPAAQYSAQNLLLQNAVIGDIVVNFDIVSRDYASELWPGITASQVRLPGPFKR